MPTNWADPTLSNEVRVRALHVNQLRSVVNQNRSHGGFERVSWTDNPAQSSVLIRSVHFTELKDAIQPLWTAQGLGTIPGWTAGSDPSSARRISWHDTEDLRTWIQQYQDATGVSYDPVDPVVGPFRGIHLPHDDDLRPIDEVALDLFAPGAVVAFLNQAHTFLTLRQWLIDHQFSVEIFLRYFECPVVPLYTPGYSNYFNISSSAKHIDAVSAANEIRDQVTQLYSDGLTNFKVIIGNEPEIEWDTTGSQQWYISFWNDITQYFTAIYDTARGLGVQAELYPPAFMQGAFVAVANLNLDGTVVRSAVTASGRSLDFHNYDDEYGAYYVQSLIDHYNNGSPNGRLAVHSYFWPGFASAQVIDNLLPGFIMLRVQSGMPSRVTEYGWFPQAVDPTQCPSPYCCPGDLNSTTTSCNGAIIGITGGTDYTDYLENLALLGGYNLWLLADHIAMTTPGAVAVDQAGTIRSWFPAFIYDCSP